MATDLTVANMIRDQIGRGAFFMMGSKNLSGDKNSLTFDIKLCKAWKWVKVTLEPDDTYTVTFIMVGRGPQYKRTEKSINGVYVDMLHDVIEENTGLVLRIPRVRGINA
jgi:hypothetical protein